LILLTRTVLLLLSYCLTLTDSYCLALTILLSCSYCFTILLLLSCYFFYYLTLTILLLLSCRFERNIIVVALTILLLLSYSYYLTVTHVRRHCLAHKWNLRKILIYPAPEILYSTTIGKSCDMLIITELERGVAFLKELRYRRGKD
jgi:hypothetical protein